MLFLGTTIDGLQMGLCFAIIALGVYLSYSILDFPDLSVDGTFPLGGVCATIFMLRLGINPIRATLLAFFVGMAAGAVTGLLHVKFRISKLLSGIIVMTALLSVNLALTKLLTGTGYTTTIFSYKSKGLAGMFGGKAVKIFGDSAMAKDMATIIILLLAVIFCKVLIDLFKKTKMGYMLGATGGSERLVTYLGKDPGTYKVLGISLANGFVSMGGALYSQLYMQYDNNSGSGKVVLALASVIIGMAVFSNIRFMQKTTAVVLGAIIYSLCLNYLVLVDRDGIYLKLMNAVLFALILIFNDKITSFLSKKQIKAGGKNA